MTRFATWSLARLSRSTRQALASRERSRKWLWSELAVGKAASVGGLLAHFANVAFSPLSTKTSVRLHFRLSGHSLDSRRLPSLGAEPNNAIATTTSAFPERKFSEP